MARLVSFSFAHHSPVTVNHNTLIENKGANDFLDSFFLCMAFAYRDTTLTPNKLRTSFEHDRKRKDPHAELLIFCLRTCGELFPRKSLSGSKVLKRENLHFASCPETRHWQKWHSVVLLHMTRTSCLALQTAYTKFVCKLKGPSWTIG